MQGDVFMIATLFPSSLCLVVRDGGYQNLAAPEIGKRNQVVIHPDGVFVGRLTFRLER